MVIFYIVFIFLAADENSDVDESGIVFSASCDSTPTSTLTKKNVVERGMTEAASNETLTATEDDDLSAYIIPPPPSSTKTVEEQNRVLARFRQVAEEVCRMMAHSNEPGSKYSESMNSVSKFCTIPRRHEEAHRPSLSSLASLVTPVRETHTKLGSGFFPGNGEASGSSSKNSSKDNGLDEDEETSGYRPQPPPRFKRNSIPADFGHSNHMTNMSSEGSQKNSGNHSDLYTRASPSNTSDHTSQVNSFSFSKLVFIKNKLLLTNKVDSCRFSP